MCESSPQPHTYQICYLTYVTPPVRSPNLEARYIQIRPNYSEFECRRRSMCHYPSGSVFLSLCLQSEPRKFSDFLRKYFSKSLSFGLCVCEARQAKTTTARAQRWRSPLAMARNLLWTRDWPRDRTQPRQPTQEELMIESG